MSLKSRLRHFYYRDLINYYKTTYDYSRRLALGLNLKSDFYQEVFIDIPKDNMLYTQHGIQYAELYLGKQVINCDGLDLYCENQDNLFMVYQESNFVERRNWTGLYCDFIIYDISEELKSNCLYYYYGMKFNVDLSDYIFVFQKHLHIKNYDCLDSIMKCNVKIPAKELICEYTMYLDSNESLINYMYLFSDINKLINLFSTSLDLITLNLTLPMSYKHVEWSINNINKIIYILDLYVNLVKDKSKELNYFKSLNIYFYDISNKDSYLNECYLTETVSNNNLSINKIDISNYLTDEKLHYIREITGLKVHLYTL